MPRVDGIEVLRRLKADPTTATLPVIMLTTTDDPREVDRCDLGCASYVTKPVEYDEVHRGRPPTRPVPHRSSPARQCVIGDVPMMTTEHATILVVEDDPGIAELESGRLMEAGYVVLRDGRRGDRPPSRRRVDLILLDYRLPGGVRPASTSTPHVQGRPASTCRSSW